MVVTLTLPMTLVLIRFLRCKEAIMDHETAYKALSIEDIIEKLSLDDQSKKMSSATG